MIIKKFEMNYFSAIYGDEFHYMREIDIQPVLNYESLIFQEFIRFSL